MQQISVSALTSAEVLTYETTGTPGYFSFNSLTSLPVTEEDKEHTAGLAIAKEDLKLLAQALAKAKQLNLQDDAIGRAETQKSQIEARQEATVALKAAVSSGNAASISAALSRACQLGCNKGDIETAEKALSKLGAASKLLGKLR